MSRKYETAFVFDRRLGIPRWAIVFFTVAVTAPPPATLLPMPSTALWIIAALWTAAIVSSITWLRTSHAVAYIHLDTENPQGPPLPRS